MLIMAFGVADDFNPRSPHGERQAVLIASTCCLVFQPTLPARGATEMEQEYIYDANDFNPRSPHGERPVPRHVRVSAVLISTHAPRTGSDGASRINSSKVSAFQPTLPARGATERVVVRAAKPMPFQPTLPARGATPRPGGDEGRREISTHAPRTGSDALLKISL